MGCLKIGDDVVQGGLVIEVLVGFGLVINPDSSLVTV